MKTKNFLLTFSIVLLLMIVGLVACTKDPNLDPTKLAITTNSGPGGNVTPPGKTEVDKGGNLNVVAKSLDGFIIDEVKVDGKVVSVPENLTTFTYPFSEVVADHTFEATFKKVVVIHNVEILPTVGGTVTSNLSQVADGLGVIFTFTNDPGFLKPDSVIINGVSFPLIGNTYSKSNVTTDLKVKGVFAMTDTMRLFVKKSWKQDSLLIRETNGVWKRYALWGVPTEHQIVLTLLPNGTFKVDTDGNPGDGLWSFDSSKNPPLFHMGMSPEVPEGAVSEIEKLDETTLVLANYNVPSIDPQDTTKGASKVIFTPLN